MPNGHHSVLAELLQRRGIVVVPRQHVHWKIRGNVDEGLHRYERVAELGERLGLHDSLNGLDALHAPAEVLGLLEVVEGDRGVVVWVSVLELEMAGGERPYDLFQDETASE